RYSGPHSLDRNVAILRYCFLIHGTIQLVVTGFVGRVEARRSAGRAPTVWRREKTSGLEDSTYETRTRLHQPDRVSSRLGPDAVPLGRGAVVVQGLVRP